MEDNEDEEYQLQMLQGIKLSAYISKFKDIAERLARMEVQHEDDMCVYNQQAIASSSKNE